MDQWEAGWLSGALCVCMFHLLVRDFESLQRDNKTKWPDVLLTKQILVQNMETLWLAFKGNLL
jgi:hypothetical protein